jgi:GNAT superfamily N-acetyltransferase
MQLQTPTGVTISALTADDIPAAMTLKNELGWNQTPEDWARFLRLAPDGAFKLVVEGELAGTALAFVFDEVCWIGMVIVREPHRGHGHGNMLVQRCLDYAASRRCTLVQLDATKYAVSLYARLGFKPDQLVGTCRGRIVPPEGGTEAENLTEAEARREGLSLAPVSRRDLEELAALDSQALGADREPLIRELVIGRGAGEPARATRGTLCRSPSGELEAFLLCRPGYQSVQVGPLIARDELAAAEVLRAAFREICGRAPQCDVTLTVPLHNQGMLAELRRWGLPVTPRLTRMFRGRKRLQAREDMVYALSGPEKG